MPGLGDNLMPPDDQDPDALPYSWHYCMDTDVPISSSRYDVVQGMLNELYPEVNSDDENKPYCEFHCFAQHQVVKT